MNAFAAAERAQAQAADPALNVFVTANAGSGKTKVLVDRIARLLLRGAEPSSFLCITYTKAAAAEMQRRLFKQLGDWCVADDVRLAEALARVTDGDSVSLDQARALFARALETPGGLKIQTIHAFCERLLARFPLEAGVPPGFDVADDARAAALMAEARAALIASEDGEIRRAFDRFAEKLDIDRLDALVASLALGRADADQDAASIRARHGATQDADAIKADVLASAPWPALLDAAGVLSGDGVKNDQLAECIRSAHEAMQSAHAFAAYCDIFFTKDGAPRADRPTKGARVKHAFIDRLFSSDGELGRVVDARARILAAERAADAAAASLLAQGLRSAYAAAKTRSGVLDFEDLIRLARALLGGADSAPWVLYKLDGGVDHILIDEGQDTSPDQWALLAPLQTEFFAGAGRREDTRRTVFAVGDPKQSIYSFQGADPSFFLNERQALSRRATDAGRDFAAPNLSMSFRSTPEVLRAVDAVCADLDLAAGAPEKFDIVRHDVRRANEGGLVELWPIAPRLKAAEGRPWDAPLDMEKSASAPARLAEAIAKYARAAIEAGEGVWEKGALRPMHAGDILVLVRKRGELFRALIRAFKRERLAVAGADRMRLSEELAVEDCLALMRVALDPHDDLSLAEVLKGPWLNLIDDDAHIFPLAHGRASGESLWDRLRAAEGPAFAPARAFVEALVARAGADAFSFLSWALETPDESGASGWARIFARLGAEARDPLEELMERALAPGPHGAPTLHRFLADIETDCVDVKREMESGAEAVRVMTVHGAKGLEAPIVFLPDTTGSPLTNGREGLMAGADGLYWSPSKKEDDAASARVRAALEERAMGEHWRLLYVAMTRARDRLIVCGAAYGSGEAEADKQSWYVRVRDAMATIAAPAQTPFGEGLRIGEPRMAARLAAIAPSTHALPDWVGTPAPTRASPARAAPSRLKPLDAAILSPRRDGRIRFRRGKLIHGLLERLPDLEPARRRDAGLAWLARQETSSDEAEALVGESLRVIDHPAFAAVFGPGSRAETPIAGMARARPVRGIVDRLVVRPDEVLIVDFKSDRPAPARAEDAPVSYVLQMALYRAVLQQIFPARAVRCALIWTEAPVLTELEAPRLEAALGALPLG